MRRLVPAALLALLPIALALLPRAAFAQTAQQTLVDRATLTVQEMLTIPDPSGRIDTLRRARAVMICPRVFRAGFVIGGTGGNCVLTARDGAGSWSSPAFYQLQSASIGLQIGVQDSEVMMMVMTNAGLSALMDTQFKFGGDASVAFASDGAGVDASATSGLHADIIAYSQGSGLFVGATLNGGMLITDTPANRAYYGRDLAARQVVLQMETSNPGADPLRVMLGRFGAPVTAHLDAPAQQAFSDPSSRSVPSAETLAPVRATPLAPPTRR
jgi:lipid-binding SYLF domain-containing protein